MTTASSRLTSLRPAVTRSSASWRFASSGRWSEYGASRIAQGFHEPPVRPRAVADACHAQGGELRHGRQGRQRHYIDGQRRARGARGRFEPQQPTSCRWRLPSPRPPPLFARCRGPRRCTASAVRPECAGHETPSPKLAVYSPATSCVTISRPVPATGGHYLSDRLTGGPPKTGNVVVRKYDCVLMTDAAGGILADRPTIAMERWLRCTATATPKSSGPQGPAPRHRG